MSIYETSMIMLLVLWPSFRVFKDSQRKYCIAATIILILVLGLRDSLSVGVDLVRYNRHFERLASCSLWDSLTYDMGSSALYYFVNWMFQKLNLSFQFFVLVLATFQMSVVGHFFARYSVHPLFSYLIMFGTGSFTFLFSGLRQGAAMVFVVLCFEAYMEKRWKEMVVFLLIAVGFHSTAIVIIPFLLITQIRFSKLLTVIYLIVFLGCMIFRVYLGRLITIIYQEEYVGAYESMIELGGTAIFCIMVAVLFFVVCYKKIMEKNTLEFYLAHGMVLLNILQVCSSYSYAYTRLNLYYMLLVMTIALPKIAEKSNLQNICGRFTCIVRPVIYVVCAVVMLSQFGGYIKGEMLAEYKFFWEHN